jgi:PIN domain nuclease of toxin-antitoxin system
VLLDSHFVLWFLAGDRRRIGKDLRTRIETEPAIVSVASLWEIAIKLDLGKLEAPEDLPARTEEAGFEILAVSAEHAWQVRRLPSHHRDPFDRMLIAQAQVEREAILTADPIFASYDVVLVGH